MNHQPQPVPPEPGESSACSGGAHSLGSGALSLAGLALLTLLMFGDVLFAPGERVLSSFGLDLSDQFIHWRAFGFEQLRRGNLPLWNPHLFSGTPFLGGFQSALLYPPNALFLALPLAKAINWSIALHVFLAGAFTWRWTAQRGLHPLASFLSAVIFMFCGAHFLHIYAGHLSNLCAMVWAPLLFLALDGLFEQPSLGWGLLGMFAVAMQVLAGHPQYLFYTGVAAGIYSALCGFQARRRKLFFGGLAAIVAGGIALSAVQLFTSLGEAPETLRRAGVPFRFAAMFSFPPENLLTLLAPHLFGDIKTVPYWGRCSFWEMSLFLSLTGFILVIVGAVWGDARARRFSLIMVVLLLLLAFGAHTPLFRVLYDWVPGFNKFRGSSKFIFLASLFLALLAGLGFDELVRGRRLPRPFLGALAAIGLLLLGVAVVARPASPSAPAAGLWQSVLLAIGSTGECYLATGACHNPAFVVAAARLACQSLFIAGATMTLVALLLWCLRRWRPALGLVLALAVVELFVFARLSLDHFDLEQAVNPAIKKFLEQHPGDYRIANLDAPNTALSLRAQEVWGYEPGVVLRYAQLLAFARGLRSDQAVLLTAMENVLWPNHPLLSLLRCRFLFSLKDGQLVIDETTNCLPHVLLVQRCRVLSNRDQILSTLTNAAFKPSQEVILETPPDPPPVISSDPGSVSLTDSSTDHLTIEADLRSAAILLIPDVYAKGWRARGLPGSVQTHYRVQPANWCLRAIPLAAGHHRLRLEYLPAGFRLGKWTSVLSLGVFLALLGWRWGTARPRSREHLASLETRPCAHTPSPTMTPSVPQKVRAPWPALPTTAVGLAVLLLAAFAVFWPCLNGSFLWDDDVMLTQNPLVKSPAGLGGIWFSTRPFDYYPLTLTSFWIEWRLWRLQPAGYHVANVLLHALSAFLLWRVLKRLKVPGAFVAAALFVVHPVCVASVAWIAERKNTLSLLFFFLSLLWFLRFDEQEPAPHATHPASRSPSASYLLSLAAFLLALLSKASVVVLPFVLLLCRWWRRGRITRQDLLRTAPFFLLALALGLVTVWFQSHRAMGGPEQHTDPLLIRILGGTWAVWFYLARALVPVNLSVMYPRWAIAPASPWSYVPGLMLLGLFAVLWRYRAGWARPLLFGFACFVVTLLPVLGLFDTYYFSLSRVADHWQYLSISGIIALAVGLAASGLGGWDHGLKPLTSRWLRLVGPGLAVLLLAAFAIGSWKRAAIYTRPVLLWRDAVNQAPQSSVARNYYGNALESEGKLDEAIAQYAAVQRFMPANVDACVNLGIVLARKGELDTALAQLRRALELNPRDPDAHFNLASVLSRQGKFDEALPHYHEALHSYFYRVEAHNELGNLFCRQGKTNDALFHYREAIRLDPDFALARQNLANLLLAQGQLSAALNQYALAAQANPALPEARYNLGLAALATGRYGEAADHFRAALAAQPDFAEAHYNLGLSLERQGRTDEAIAQYQAALQAKPDHAQSHYALANALLKRQQSTLARHHYEAALKSQPDYAEAHYQLGVLLLADKDTAGAIRHWRAALRLKPDWLALLNNLAWVLATHPDPNVRDGTQAVKLASRVAELTRQPDAGALDTLAAAYAEAGQYPEAIAAAERGLKLAIAARDKGLVNQLQARLELYRAGRPYRE